MCTIGRTTVKTAGKAHHRPDTEECTVRREQGRTDCGSKRGRNSFLSTALIPLAQMSLAVDCYDGCECDKINVITQDNYEFLRDSFFRYSRLLQKEGIHTPGNSVGEGIGTFWDDYEADFMFEILSEDDGSNPADRKERMKLLDSYQEGICCGATHARAARGISGTIPHRNG